MALETFLTKHKTQEDIDNKIGDIMKNLKTDEVTLQLFDIGLLDFIMKTMLSDRQIAKKITSYAVNPLSGVPFSDKELNYMYYGQDLAANEIFTYNPATDDYIKIANPGYVPYFTETEDMVTYGAGYEPIDIRDMIKKTIHDLKQEVKREIKNFENGIKELYHSIPKVFEKISASTQTIATQLTAASTVVLAPLAINPGLLTKIATDLHEAGALLRKIIKDILNATLIFQVGNSMFSGASLAPQVNVASVIKPAINGAGPIKKLIKAEIQQIPKIKLLLPDEVHAVINDIIYVILDILDAASSALIAIDAAAVAAEVLAITVGPPPDVASGAVLAAQLTAIAGFNTTIQAAFATAKTAITSYVGQAIKG